MTHRPESPIGIFDSGIGGLTVAHAIHQFLPHENLIYFGDTAHLPYGDKSEASIQTYSIKIADMLLQKKCKAIVIACNSASSAAYELLKEYLRNQVLIINVIDPMVDLVISTLTHKKVGLIGTKRTVHTGVYLKKISEIDPSIQLKSLATPLLAPMIEEGFFNNQISHDIISNYLTDPLLAQIDALILACTHYPLIKKEIETFYHHRIPILDSTQAIAKSIQNGLEKMNLLKTKGVAKLEFMISDYTDSFESSAHFFFGQKIQLKWYSIWN